MNMTERERSIVRMCGSLYRDEDGNAVSPLEIYTDGHGQFWTLDGDTRRSVTRVDLSLENAVRLGMFDL